MLTPVRRTEPTYQVLPISSRRLGAVDVAGSSTTRPACRPVRAPRTSARCRAAARTAACRPSRRPCSGVGALVNHSRASVTVGRRRRDLRDVLDGSAVPASPTRAPVSVTGSTKPLIGTCASRRRPTPPPSPAPTAPPRPARAPRRRRGRTPATPAGRRRAGSTTRQHGQQHRNRQRRSRSHPSRDAAGRHRRRDDQRRGQHHDQLTDPESRRGYRRSSPTLPPIALARPPPSAWSQPRQPRADQRSPPRTARRTIRGAGEPCDETIGSTGSPT